MPSEHRWGGRPPRPTGLTRALSLCNSTQDILEELVNGFHYCTSLDEGKVHRATDTTQCWTEVRAGPQGSPDPEPRDDQGAPRTQTQIWGLRGEAHGPTHKGTWTCAAPTSYGGE